MSELTMAAVTGQLGDVLHEAFEGAPNPWSYFIDRGPDAGLFGMLGRLSAEEASRTIGSSTIAADINHLTFSLAASAAWIRGDRTPRDWPTSWQITAVDEGAWTHLLAQLRERYTDLRQAIDEHGAASVEALGGTVGAIAHAAYHLGTIQHKVGVIRHGDCGAAPTG